MVRPVENPQPPYVEGKFTMAFHFYPDHRELNHLDLFLHPPEYDCLITYKLPKKKIHEPAVLQKNHRLRYLTYEGQIHNGQEKIRIVKKGFFLAHSWIISDNLLEFIHIIWEPAPQNNNKLKNNKIEKKSPRENMWKKADFKLAIDEIKLYEITEEKTAIQIKPRDQNPENDERKLPIDLKPDDLKIETKEPVSEEEKTKPEAIPEKINPPLMEDMPGEKSSPETETHAIQTEDEMSQLSKFNTDEEIEFVSVQEMVLEESGKTSREYKSTP